MANQDNALSRKPSVEEVERQLNAELYGHWFDLYTKKIEEIVGAYQKTGRIGSRSCWSSEEKAEISKCVRKLEEFATKLGFLDNMSRDQIKAFEWCPYDEMRRHMEARKLVDGSVLKAKRITRYGT